VITQISASAGSGKTYSLTRLFLELLAGAEAAPLAAGFPPDARRVRSLPEILAATFTNKAAAEMKNRVIESLKEQALEERGKAARTGGAPGFAETWVERILRHYGDLNIRTIDSLLTTLTRLSALDLHLPPDFEPAFEPAQYFTPVYDALMEDLAAAGRFPEPLSGWGAPRRGGEERPIRHSADPATLRADLLDACRCLISFGEGSGFTLKNRLHDQVLELVGLLLAGRDLPRMEIPAILAVCAKQRDRLAGAARTLRGLLAGERLEGKAHFLRALDGCVALEGHDPPPQGASARKDSLDECLNAASKGKASAKTLSAFAEFSTALADYDQSLPLFRQALQFAPLTDLALEIHSRMQAASVSGTILPAARIPLLARRALSGEYGVSDAICRLGTRLSRLLLDEFQDTSREQWAAILPLVEESLATGGSLTYVGDVKQAIYGWRGGDTRLFDEILREPSLLAMRPRVERRSLSFNWRSHPRIVRHNNAFFSLLRDDGVRGEVMRVMLPAHTPEDRLAGAAAELGRAFSQVEQGVPEEKNWEKDPSSAHADVCLYMAEADTVEAVRDLVRERLRALFLHELLPVWRPGDIAVLTPSGDEGSLAAGWLADWGVPVVTENSFLLDAHPLVGKIISFLSFLDYPPDDMAFWESVSDPDIFWPDSGLSAADLSDWLSRTALGREKARGSRPSLYRLFSESFPGFWNGRIAPFHAGAGFMSAYDLMRELIIRSRLFERMPDQCAFPLRLLEVAHLAETRGRSCLTAFLAFWREHRGEERLPLPESMDAVRVMTIHKAKGLEFPVVVLPFQHHSISRRPEPVVFHRAGLDLVARAGKELPDRYYPAKSADELERLNLLYVAWTRPVYALHAFITRPKRYSTSLRRALSVLLDAYEQRTGMSLCRREHLGVSPQTLPGEVFAGRGASSPGAERAASASPHGGTAPGAAPGRENRGDLSLPEEGGEASSPHVTPGPGHPRAATGAEASARPQESRTGDAAAGARLMDWLPRLKIFRSGLEDARLTPDRRGVLIHLCLERLTPPWPADREGIGRAVEMAVRRAMRLFPLPLDDPESAAADARDCLLWFVSRPEAPLWLAYGRREQVLVDTDGNLHRVDLLVDEALFADPALPSPGVLALDYKTGSAVAQAGREEHRRQVRRYMRLVADACRRPVRGALAYLDERRLEEVLL
jgi:superfamily I DNA/RNA helicase